MGPIGIYGVNFYGTAYYGPDPQFLPSDYTVYPFTAEALDYNLMFLQWRKPTLLYPPLPQGSTPTTPQASTPQASTPYYPQGATPGLQDLPTARVRLLRNSLNIPSDENDGVQLFDLPMVTSPRNWQDNRVIPGQFVYYTIFVFDGFMWQRGGDVIGLSPKYWGYQQDLYKLLPSVYRTWDEGLVDPTKQPSPKLAGGPLQRFLNMVGQEYDLIRTELESLLMAYDPQRCSGGLVPLLAQELGMSFEKQMGMRLARNFLSNAVHYYKTKGTYPCIEGVTADTTGWSAKVSTGYNLVLDQNDAAATQSVGRWTLTARSGTPALTRATIPVSPGPGNPPVIGTQNLLGPTTAMVFSANAPIAGSNVLAPPWSFMLHDGDPTQAVLQGIPLQQGTATLSYVTVSRYFYPLNDHNFVAAVSFFNGAGQQIGGQVLGPSFTATPANAWTRVWNTFAVPGGAMYMITYYYSSDSFAANEKVWTTAGQVEAATTAPTAPKTWEPARDVRIDLRPERINLVINPSFENNASNWSAAFNCGIARSAPPPSLNRWPILRQSEVFFSENTTRLLVAIPPGVPNTDCLLVTITVPGNTNVTAPGNWEEVAKSSTGGTSEDVQKITYSRVANDEPASYMWIFSNSTAVIAEIFDYYNTDPVAPVQAAIFDPPFQGDGSLVTIPAQSIPTSVITGQQIVLIGTNPTSSMQTPPGLARRTTQTTGSLTTNTFDRNVTGPGSMGSVSGSLSTRTKWLGHAIILKASPLPPQQAAYEGSYSLAVTSSAAGRMSVTSDPMPVTAGLYYSASAYAIAQSISEPVQVFLNWLDESFNPLSGASAVPGLLVPGETEPAQMGILQVTPVYEVNLIESSPIFSENTQGGIWVRPGVTAIAPPGASAASITVQWNMTLAPGETHFLDAVLFEQAASVRSYFDGSTPLNGAAFVPPISADYLWEALPGNTVPTPGNGLSTYYSRRTQKNLRLMEILPQFLPAGATMSLLYAQST